MRLNITYSNIPDIKAKSTAKLKLGITLPDEIIHLINVEDRIREIGKQIGHLTLGSVHITCADLGIKDELVGSKEFDGDTNRFLLPFPALVIYHSRFIYHANIRKKNCILYIPQPIDPQKLDLPHSLVASYGRRKKKTLAGNIRRLDNSWVKTDEQRQYVTAIQTISEQTNILLNTEPVVAQFGGGWEFGGFHPYWLDNKIKKFGQKERKRLWDLEHEKPSPKKSKKHGKGNRVGAIPGKFMGIQFRSQLEIRFATEVQKRGIEWIYEEERLGDGNYLVDFHLPNKKAWIEVKGRFEARDHFLLKEVAEVLEHRGEKLYVFTSGKPMIVTSDEFTPIPRKEFWALIEE